MFGMLDGVEVVKPRADEIDYVHSMYFEIVNAAAGSSRQRVDHAGGDGTGAGLRRRGGVPGNRLRAGASGCDPAGNGVTAGERHWGGEALWHTRIERMTLEELRVQHRQRILELAGQRGAHNVRVFGSIARGEQRADSDVDLLVDFEPGRSLLDLTGLWLDLEQALGRRVDVVSSRGLRPRVAAEVLRDAIAL